MSPVIVEEGVRIPPWLTDLKSFRRWRRSREYPDRGQISYLDGDVWVNMNMEQLFSHNRVKTHLTIRIGGLVEEEALGTIFRIARPSLTRRPSWRPNPTALFVHIPPWRTGAFA